MVSEKKKRKKKKKIYNEIYIIKTSCKSTTIYL